MLQEVSIVRNCLKRLAADQTSNRAARIPKAANWAAASFMLGSVIQFEVCQYQREEERKAMARAVEIIDRKKTEKMARAEEVARLRTEVREKAKQAEQKSWYKFW
jgi:cytochrome c oxidase assembly protein subunit 20